MAEHRPDVAVKNQSGSASLRTIDVELLLEGQQVVRLVYRGVEYRLRVTRQGKLLLTK